MIDLNTCKKGDILISSHGLRLEYISKTPWKNYSYLDHVVKYPSDGFVFAKNRKPEVDHDIVEIIQK